MLKRPHPQSLRRLIAFALMAAFLTGCARGEVVSATVDIANDPGPDTQTLDLLISFGDCADGMVPTGVESVLIDETEEAVVLEVFVRLPSRLIWDNEVTCPGNSSRLPLTIELSEPLGDRPLRYRNNANRVGEVWVMPP